MSVSGEAFCINCLKPVNRHRPWCEQIRTTAPPEQGDIIDHPTLGPTELISVYSRQQAIADGVLVDCTDEPFDELNRNAGLLFDVALTRAVFERYVEVPERFQASQDIKGRYWDIIWMYRFAVKRRRVDGTELLFKFLCLPNGSGVQDNEKQSGSHTLVQLKAMVGPGDRGEPCLTFMFPSED